MKNSNIKYNIYFTLFKKMCIRIIAAFIADKKKRRSFRDTRIIDLQKQYLRKYLYVLNNNKTMNDNILLFNNLKKGGVELQKYIWVCWLQGYSNAPDIVKASINFLKKNKPDNYELIFIDINNIKDYVYIPDYIYYKKEKGYITNTEFSDILRLHLLDKYGGIWIDSTAFLLKQIPNDILNADFFAYHVSSGHYKVNNWIIVSKPHNIITNSMKKIMLEYWKHEKMMLNYFL